MRAAALMLCLSFLVAGCGEGEKERMSAFAQACANAGFTPLQCGFLYAVAKAASDAGNSAAQASTMSALAIGLSAGAATAGGR